MSDKIAAIATGHARTGIGVLRLSGDGCIEAAEQVFRLNSGRPLSSLSDRKLALGTPRIPTPARIPPKFSATAPPQH